jgi:DNA-binding response OmpR family regulator
MGVKRCKIFSFGYDLELLEKRDADLRAAGFEVESCSSLERGLKVARSSHYDLAIVGHAVGERDRNRLAAALKSGERWVPVIFLYRSGIRNAGLADAVLSISTGSKGLVSAATDLIATTRSAGCGG